MKSETKPSAAADAAKDAAAKAAQSVPPVGAKPGDAKPLDPKATTASATAGKPGDAKPTDPKVADPKAAAAKPDPKTDPAKSKVAETTAPKRSGSGVGGFFTHMAAGIVGGFLALLGADTIGEKLHQYLPELGLPAGGSAALNETTSKLQARMAELEQSVKQGRAADLASKLAATEATLKEVRQTQGKLVEELPRSPSVSASRPEVTPRTHAWSSSRKSSPPSPLPPRPTLRRAASRNSRP